jgi:hypothetical protein
MTRFSWFMAVLRVDIDPIESRGERFLRRNLSRGPIHGLGHGAAILRADDRCLTVVAR